MIETFVMEDLSGFTVDELRGYLPAGWGLVSAGQPAAPDGREGAWRVTLVDGADVRRELVVEVAAMERHGRTEALRLAVDRLYREALS